MQNFIFGKSDAMKLAMERLEKVIPTQMTVLFEGETGVGKTDLARYVHERSNQRHGPFMDMDVGAIPANLVESELFGHEKGAFTGAEKTPIGLIEQADGGTLFLDEIHNLSYEVQTKYLKFLDHGTFRRVGGQKELRSCFRLIVATNENLEQRLAAGSFRRDLYFRLKQATVVIPPLRERREDILLLAEHYLQIYGAEFCKNVALSEAAKALLLSYPWPGNIRELMNVLQEAVLHCNNGVLQPEDFALKMRRNALVVTEKKNGLSLEEIERQYIEIVLASTNGNVMQACKILRIDRSTLYRKIKNNGM